MVDFLYNHWLFFVIILFVIVLIFIANQKSKSARCPKCKKKANRREIAFITLGKAYSFDDEDVLQAINKVENDIDSLKNDPDKLFEYILASSKQAIISPDKPKDVIKGKRYPAIYKILVAVVYCPFCEDCRLYLHHYAPAFKSGWVESRGKLKQIKIGKETGKKIVLIKGK